MKIYLFTPPDAMNVKEVGIVEMNLQAIQLAISSSAG
jgi:hypothetical protein